MGSDARPRNERLGSTAGSTARLAPHSRLSLSRSHSAPSCGRPCFLFSVTPDFCWNVIDIPTGSILQVDAECNSNRDLGYTFEGHISNFKRFLEERKEKEKNKPAAEAAAAAGAGADGEATSASSSSRGPSLADEFNASPLSGQSRGMGYTQAQKYYKAYKKAERSQ